MSKKYAINRFAIVQAATKIGKLVQKSSEQLGVTEDDLIEAAKEYIQYQKDIKS